jgi:hypothetical protein
MNARVLPFLASLTLAFLVSGCVTALHVASPPTPVQLRLQSSQPQQHIVRVALETPADYQVASDGRVQFTVPPFWNGCDVYVFGVIKVRDGSAENVRVVELRREGRIVRKLSLAEISKLPKDEAGFSVVKFRD